MSTDSYKVEDLSEDVTLKINGILWGKFASQVSHVQLKIYYVEATQAIMGFEPFYFRLPGTAVRTVISPVIDSYFETIININPEDLMETKDRLDSLKTIQVHIMVLDQGNGAWYTDKVLNFFPDKE